ncbi:MAG: orotate phosphoribosyltransferase [Acidobacteria bacterium]|nr:orotate phosphoribosyltransferase [Acidobacteriota bacterium]
MSLQEDRALVQGLLSTRSVKRGDFVLASGKRSSIYCDARVTTCHARAMPAIGRLFLAKITELGWDPEAVGGLTMGADPIVMAVAHESALAGQPVNGFLVRKEAKGHGTKRQIEGLLEGEARRVVIVDDVCTTGDSTVKAIEASREAGFEVLGALCLVDREEGAEANIAGALNCPFGRIFRIAEL